MVAISLHCYTGEPQRILATLHAMPISKCKQYTSLLRRLHASAYFLLHNKCYTICTVPVIKHIVAIGWAVCVCLYACHRYGGRLPERQAVEMVLQPFLTVLHYLHQQGILHR